MLLKTKTVFNRDMATKPVIVEVNVTSKGFPSFDIIGMAGKSVQESKERIRSAINSCGFSFPQQKVLVNLFPADIPKFGTNFDLPIAVSVLAFLLNKKLPDNLFFYGELSLDGSLVYCKGGFNMGLYLRENYSDSNLIAVVSKKNAGEYCGLVGLKYLEINHLMDLVPLIKSNFTNVSSLNLGKEENFVGKNFVNQEVITAGTKIEDIAGHSRVKRALLISVAGRHNLLMMGSPGNGKSMLATSIKSFLPSLTYNECLEVTKVYSYAGLLNEHNLLVTGTPFRNPHHSCSEASLVGGGSVFKPGEISLAHKGVLFLDEFLEFSESKLNLLRQPMSDGYINISKNNYSFKVPADFVLIAAANPCPCGFYGSNKVKCTCTEYARSRYLSKMSGPIRDRFEMFVPVHAPDIEKTTVSSSTNTSSKFHQILTAFKREIVSKRTLDKIDNVISNECSSVLNLASSKYNLSMRSKQGIINVSRTISYLEALQKGQPFSEVEILPDHILEALSYKIPVFDFKML